VKTEEILGTAKEERNTLLRSTTKRRKANWICHFLRRNCLLIHGIEGKKDSSDEEEDVSRYWVILRKREDTVN
jgi:hypothetical protein